MCLCVFDALATGAPPPRKLLGSAKTTCFFASLTCQCPSIMSPEPFPRARSDGHGEAKAPPPPATTRLLLDSREGALRRTLESLGVPFSQHELAVGDVELQCGRTGIVWNVERKTLLDYAASIRDGRLKAQRMRAKEFAAGNPRVRLAYIVETESTPSFLSTARVGAGAAAPAARRPGA